MIPPGMKKTVLILVPIVLLLSCGDRLPAPKTAHRVVAKYFHGYGKKFKESDFGRHRTEKVEIKDIREMQKGMAEVEAYLFLNEGPAYWVSVSLRKKTFGWRAVAWEALGVR